jgi:hypothetical protein
MIDDSDAERRGIGAPPSCYSDTATWRTCVAYARSILVKRLIGARAAMWMQWIPSFLPALAASLKAGQFDKQIELQ